jgi:hypothetical protein
MNALLSVLVLAAIALFAGAFVMWRKGAPPKQPLLMVAAAVVMLINVLIWTLPDASGEAPIEQVQTLQQ